MLATGTGEGVGGLKDADVAIQAERRPVSAAPPHLRTFQVKGP